MTIQIPNPGTGNGASGDNEFVLWSKVKDNFSDQTNAASKLIGASEVGKLTLNQNLYVGTYSPVAMMSSAETPKDLNLFTTGRGVIGRTGFTNTIPLTWTSNYTVIEARQTSNGTYQIGYSTEKSEIFYRTILNTATGTWSNWARFYSTENTTKDANGFLKAASPIVKVFADKVELNSEAVDQDVTYKKNGVGDYTITTVSGLSTDGWYIELPKDMNGNPKVAVTLEETDGVISLKTYKRIFSMETFTFEPDLEQPLDIPDTRWIDLRLNEIPVEMPDDTQTEV